MKEGIEWVHIEYFNNKVIVDLVEQPHKGILAILDEACLNVGKVTDEVRGQSLGFLTGPLPYRNLFSCLSTPHCDAMTQFLWGK